MSRDVQWSSLAVAAGLTISSVLTAAPALAQDATPSAAVCAAPALPPGSPTPMDEMEMGEPVPETEASPEAAPETAAPEASAGTPADEATTARVTAAIAALFACQADGDFQSLAALFTPAGLSAEYGITNPYDLEMMAAGSPPLTLLGVSNVQVLEDGRFSADLATAFGAAQLGAERWELVEDGDFLLVDATSDLPVEAPAGATMVEVGMADYAFELSQSTVPANTPLVFEVMNIGEFPHEVVIIKLPEGGSPDQLLDGTLGFEDVEFLGFTFSEGGQPAPDLVLSGLEAGTYTLVCFVDVPGGVPHIMHGMVADLVVE